MKNFTATLSALQQKQLNTAVRIESRDNRPQATGTRHLLKWSGYIHAMAAQGLTRAQIARCLMAIKGVDSPARLRSHVLGGSPTMTEGTMVGYVHSFCKENRITF
jgi:hypothetical protein